MKPVSRAELARLSPSELASLEDLLDQIEQHRDSGRGPWLCELAGCDGSPHPGAPAPHARPSQRPPKLSDPNWDNWLLLAGRGFGKTRCGGEWGWRMAKRFSRGGLIAPTAADARDVMVEGESGIIACAPPTFRPVYEPSKRKLTYPNGAIQMLYSAAEPDRLRGPQHEYIWADELAAWKNLQYAWDMAQMGLRLGKHPRACITTTPRPLPLIKMLAKDPMTAVVRGSTYDNLTNLAPTFRRAVVARYEGTTLGRQELDAEILDDMPGALVARTLITENRVDEHPILRTITVGMDPAGTGTGDETGLVVVGRGMDKRDYVLEDASARMGPDEAAKRAYRLRDKWNADKIIVEDNGGKDWIEGVLRMVWKHELGRDGAPPIRRVNAAQGKQLRAQPVGMRYEQGRISHVGDPEALEQLEEQLTTWVPEDDPTKSPDRLDALVHAVSYHMRMYDRGEVALSDPHKRAEGVAAPGLVRPAQTRGMPGRMRTA